jgi:hypothetical protein
LQIAAARVGVEVREFNSIPEFVRLLPQADAFVLRACEPSSEAVNAMARFIEGGKRGIFMYCGLRQSYTQINPIMIELLGVAFAAADRALWNQDITVDIGQYLPVTSGLMLYLGNGSYNQSLPPYFDGELEILRDATPSASVRHPLTGYEYTLGALVTRGAGQLLVAVGTVNTGQSPFSDALFERADNARAAEFLIGWLLRRN